MTNFALYVLLGLVAGAFSGLIGIDGGVIIVPALAFCSASPNTARREPRWPCWWRLLDWLAAWTYYKQGYVDLRVAPLI